MLMLFFALKRSTPIAQKTLTLILFKSFFIVFELQARMWQTDRRRERRRKDSQNAQCVQKTSIVNEMSILSRI